MRFYARLARRMTLRTHDRAHARQFDRGMVVLVKELREGYAISLSWQGRTYGATVKRGTLA